MSANQHGWLILHKPLHISSAKAVAQAKRLLGVKKVGHTGTLDPLASGVLPLALGEATKLARFLEGCDKEYEFTVKWGEATTTCDLEGEVVERSDHRPSLEQIEAILPQWTGNIEQVPPIYSAIKVGGKRAYALARQGKEVVLAPRIITLKTFTLVEYADQTSTFRVLCSKGTYIRSLARDLAVALGTCGHVTVLKRTKVGKFCLEHAILLEELDQMVYKHEHSRWILPLEEVLDDIPVLSFSLDEKTYLTHGQKVLKPCDYPEGKLISLWCDGRLFGLGEVTEQYVKPTRIFNL